MVLSQSPHLNCAASAAASAAAEVRRRRPGRDERDLSDGLWLPGSNYHSAAVCRGRELLSVTSHARTLIPSPLAAVC